MEELSSIRLRHLHGQVGELVYEFTRVQFANANAPEVWRPLINAYACRTEISICMDLAGVDRSTIDVRVEPRRVSIRGRREAPEPGDGSKILQVLAMEIDYGPFARELELPHEVNPQQVTAEQQNGLLWIRLPLIPEK